ncbi:unnamed protein product [Lota lota]
MKEFAQWQAAVTRRVPRVSCLEGKVPGNMWSKHSLPLPCNSSKPMAQDQTGPDLGPSRKVTGGSIQHSFFPHYISSMMRQGWGVQGLLLFS